MVYVLQIFSIPKQNFDTVYSFIGSIILKDKECIHRILITITIVIVIMKKDLFPDHIYYDVWNICYYEDIIENKNYQLSNMVAYYY